MKLEAILKFFINRIIIHTLAVAFWAKNEWTSPLDVLDNTKPLNNWLSCCQNIKVSISRATRKNTLYIDNLYTSSDKTSPYIQRKYHWLYAKLHSFSAKQRILRVIRMTKRSKPSKHQHNLQKEFPLQLHWYKPHAGAYLEPFGLPLSWQFLLVDELQKGEALYQFCPVQISMAYALRQFLKPKDVKLSATHPKTQQHLWGPAPSLLLMLSAWMTAWYHILSFSSIPSTIYYIQIRWKHSNFDI